MTFAALQARTNAAVAAKLLTDAATLNGAAITGKFDNGFTNGLSGMMLGTNPTFTCLSVDAGSDPRGQTLVVGSTSYTVREAKPDGTGISLLELEPA
ncbi:MAG TPA: hypothetical protein VIH29_08995 [Gallionella sp.]